MSTLLWIILDGVKDHLTPHLAEKKTTKEMWDALKNLFEAKNENRKMALKAVDRPFSNGGQLMCHEDASPDANLLKTVLVLLGHLMLQHKFCKRNFRTPTWVDNVISLHGS
jgi:hypothetical protein